MVAALVAPAAATILHADMDAFFVSVEILHDRSLAGRPVVVGGTGRRGVVASASYEARAFGVRSAMSSALARRLCPKAVFVPGHYERYVEQSRRLHAILTAVTPHVEGVALDEAFLDVKGATRLFGPPPEIARRLRLQVSEELGLSLSIGVAASKMMAKLASEAAKPTATLGGVVAGREVVVIAPADELAFLHPLPVGALSGVGPATVARLHRAGIVTVGDLAHVAAATLTAVLGRSQALRLVELAWARDYRPVNSSSVSRSIGNERTYSHDRYDVDRIHAEVVSLAETAADRLRKAGLSARTVTLKCRFSNFATITRSKTTAAALVTGVDIARVALGLLDQVSTDSGIRLLGVHLSHLQADDDGAASQNGSERSEQLTLDLNAAAGLDGQTGFYSAALTKSGSTAGAQAESWAAATAAVDAITRRFGHRLVAPACVLSPPGDGASDGSFRGAKSGGANLSRRSPWGPDE